MIRAILISALVLLSWPALAGSQAEAGDSTTTTIRDNYGRRLGSIYCPSYSQTCTIRDSYGRRQGSLVCDGASCDVRDSYGRRLGSTKTDWRSGDKE